MPFDVAMENFYTQKPVDAATLRAFMKVIGARLKVEGEESCAPAVLSIKFCRLFCELAVETGDPEIVRDFFTNTDYYINKPRNNQETWAYCWGLEKRKDNDALIPVITKIARTFDWKDFGDALVSCLGISTYAPIEEDTGYSRMEMALLILDGLDTGAAQDALLKMAMEKSSKLTTEELCSSKIVGLTLKWVVRSNSNPTVDKVADLFGQLDPSLLSPALLENSLEGFDDVVVNYQKADLLTLLVSKRIDWLKNQIDGLDKPFSWQMLDAQFPDNAQVEEFLRGPATTMTMAKGVHKFKEFQDASNCAAKWMREAQINASFKMKANAINANASVTITKTRKWHAESQQKLKGYKVELAQLLKYAGGETNYGDKKRARLE
ncbi:hypothetical protein PF008_g30916 [Phytophthora fragariae]|uniref:Uncharacterized protein n=1 Tax=Phytophthora fragariae TaxID=53985 RepID=A0A6G0Q445_9STRA|nr:hypothetical protein PF008_g30916 [Phytophthora fragariae]